ncbi:MAG: hypothetical protein ABII90_10925 [Bacteroidota bacterium]
MIILENGNYSLAFDFYNRKLTTGVYLVVASCNDKDYKKKIVIQ